MFKGRLRPTELRLLPAWFRSRVHGIRQQDDCRTNQPGHQAVCQRRRYSIPLNFFTYIYRLLLPTLEYMCHAYVRGDSLAGVVISDHEYPSRVSHTLITKVLDEFAQKIVATSWPTLTERDVAFPQLNTYLAKYQNPREADAMTKIQEDLDETKIILVGGQV